MKDLLFLSLLACAHSFTLPPFAFYHNLESTPQRAYDAKITTSGNLPRNHVSTTELFGIPKMFRWLTDQYPDVLNRQLQEGISDDLSVDNFYLDMNGIIHPCTHGNAEGEIIVLDETAMFKKIFLYVDRYVFRAIRAPCFDYACLLIPNFSNNF